MKPLGSQCIAEFIDCPSELLREKKALEEILAAGIRKCGLTLIEVTGKQFDPVGVTVVAVIGESHVVIHTYPEARHASVDIFTCSNGSHAQEDLLNYLSAELKPRTIRKIQMRRGNPLEVQDDEWITSFSPRGYETRYHVRKSLLSKRSRYQQIDIIDNEDFGRMMFLDRDLQIAEKDAGLYNASLVSPIIESGVPLDRVAILGGGDGGVLSEILKYNPQSVALVDIDGEVVEAARDYLRPVCGDSFDDPRVDVRIEDANLFLEREGEFDAVIYDLTMYPEALTNDERHMFVGGIFSKIQAALRPHGIVTMQCCSDQDEETKKLLGPILDELFHGIEFTTHFIPSFCEGWRFASARATAVVAQTTKIPAGRSRRARVAFG